MQMFTRFLERKLWAQKNEDVLDILIFDEHIRLKQARARKSIIKSVRIHCTNLYRNQNQCSLMTNLKDTTQPMIVIL